VLVAVLCLVIAARGVEWDQIRDILAAASLPWLLVAVGLVVLSDAVKCNKVGVLLAGAHRPRLRSLFCAEMVGTLVDIVLPLRLLELVKSYLLGRQEGIRPSFVFGAVAVEKCIDALFLISALSVLGLCMPLPPWLQRALWLGLGSVPLGLGILAVASVRPTFLDGFLQRLGGLAIPAAQRGADMLRRMLDGMRQASVRPSALLLAAGITVVEWCILGGAFWMCGHALGEHLHVSHLVAILIANAVSFAVPTSSSSALGIYEVTVKTTLVALFAMSAEVALALALVLHAVLVTAGTLAGAVCLPLTGLTLADVRAGAERVRERRDLPG